MSGAGRAMTAVILTFPVPVTCYRPRPRGLALACLLGCAFWVVLIGSIAAVVS